MEKDDKSGKEEERRQRRETMRKEGRERAAKSLRVTATATCYCCEHCADARTLDTVLLLSIFGAGENSTGPERH